jgi:hypothetical protein
MIFLNANRLVYFFRLQLQFLCQGDGDSTDGCFVVLWNEPTRYFLLLILCLYMAV